MAPSRKPRLARRWALCLVGAAALGSVACGAVRPFGEARTIALVMAPLEPAGRTETTERAERAQPAETFEAALLARVNADRAAHGLRALELDPELVAPARARAAAQRPGEALTHAAPEVTSCAFQRLLKEAGVRYGVAGENLARPRVAPATDAAETAAAAQRALMASDTHRQNILDPAFDRMAVGAMRGADGRIVFAQLFRGA